MEDMDEEDKEPGQDSDNDKHDSEDEEDDEDDDSDDDDDDDDKADDEVDEAFRAEVKAALGDAAFNEDGEVSTNLFLKLILMILMPVLNYWLQLFKRTGIHVQSIWPSLDYKYYIRI